MLATSAGLRFRLQRGCESTLRKTGVVLGLLSPKQVFPYNGVQPARMVPEEFMGYSTHGTRFQGAGTTITCCYHRMCVVVIVSEAYFASICRLRSSLIGVTQRELTILISLNFVASCQRRASQTELRSPSPLFTKVFAYRWFKVKYLRS